MVIAGQAQRVKSELHAHLVRSPWSAGHAGRKVQRQRRQLLFVCVLNNVTPTAP